MHPQLAVALGRLDTAASELRTATAALPSSLLGHKPAPERWCVNEVLEHIGLVEQLFVKSLIANIERAKAAGLEREVAAPAMLTDHLRTVVEDRTSPRTAPERVIPTGTVDSKAALRQIEAGHAWLRQVLAECDGLALSTVTLDHRFFGTLNVYQWIELLAGHERRHRVQILELGRGAVQEA
jgi:hypothetical protein